MEIDLSKIDMKRLRDDLIDNFGTALINEYAMVDLINVQTCTDEELVIIALENNINLDDYRKMVL